MCSYSDKTDEQLLTLIDTDSQQIVEAIINRYRPTVEVIATKYINSPLEREDLIQEGMIGLYAAIKSYNSEKGAKFVTYASRCIDNSVQAALRKVSRMKDIPAASIVYLEDDSSLEGKVILSAEDEYLAQESVNIIAELLYEELSTFENEVLRLFLVGHSYNEIGEKLGKTAKAVDNAIQRIRKKLNRVTF